MYLLKELILLQHIKEAINIYLIQKNKFIHQKLLMNKIKKVYKVAHLIKTKTK